MSNNMIIKRKCETCQHGNVCMLREQYETMCSEIEELVNSHKDEMTNAVHFDWFRVLSPDCMYFMNSLTNLVGVRNRGLEGASRSSEKDNTSISTCCENIKL